MDRSHLDLGPPDPGKGPPPRGLPSESAAWALPGEDLEGDDSSSEEEVHLERERDHM